MPTARSVSDVLLGEAVSGTAEERLNDMRAIFSTIMNRAKSLGVTPEEVVSNPREFNAYGRRMPSGVESYRSLADKAMNDVMTNGPVHQGMFYATPSAADNLPKGLIQETATSGHVYYSDPQNRAIGTALGYRSPVAQTQPAETAQQAISGMLSTRAQPATPGERMGLVSAYTQPAQETDMAKMSRITPVERAPLGAMQPQMSLADQYGSYGAGKQQSMLNGLLSQDVAEQSAMNNLKQGLLAQKADLSAGVNPMDTAEPWKQPPVTAVQAPEVQQVQAPEMAYQPVAQPTQAFDSFNGAMLSPQEQQAFSAQRAMLSQMPANSAAKQKAGNLGKNLLGALGGGLLGGLTMGPIGGLLGGMLGKSMMTGRLNTMMTGYPQAPSVAGSRGNTGAISRNQLNEQGRNAYGSSGQFRDAVDNGDVGLY